MVTITHSNGNYNGHSYGNYMYNYMIVINLIISVTVLVLLYDSNSLIIVTVIHSIVTHSYGNNSS